MPAFGRLKIALAAAFVASVALGLSGCGRKGGLDLPPDSPPPPTAYDAQGNPIPPPKKQFILDPLLR